MADILVLGGGIIGLTAASRLRDRGADVTVWAADDALDTVSAVAAAAWYPTRTAYDPRVLAWAATTYTEFVRQATMRVPGVLLRPTRNLELNGTGEPWWAPAAGEVTYAPAPAPWNREVRFTAPMVEMTTYLPWLRYRLESTGVPVVRRRVTSLDEALTEAPVVVNATGLASATLGDDPAVHPVRGQIVLVPNPGLTESLRAESPDGAATYIHPRSHDIVLGGTYEENVASLEPDPATTAAILARCTALVPALAGAPVLGVRVGLRPARTGGARVAVEDRAGGTIVHAYGHGGAGMTLAWGCADAVVSLTESRADTGRAPRR